MDKLWYVWQGQKGFKDVVNEEKVRKKKVTIRPKGHKAQTQSQISQYVIKLVGCNVYIQKLTLDQINSNTNKILILIRNTSGYLNSLKYAPKILQQAN